ncbi:MAG: hypothetical protein NTV61_10315 [Candidatus Bathyarchaeota archaeon]|nr:hypothetical protein [Candidatus Bathyarchaeota archaeon]
MGTLVFVGILFTSVIPMYLVMNQADVILDQSKLTIKHTDDERANEFANVYVFPTDPQSSTSVNIQIFNKCEMPINIIRIWLNNTYYVTNLSIPPMENKIQIITVNAKNGNSYDSRVTTQRGNVYAALNGILSYGPNGWIGESFGINIVMPAREAWMNSEKWDGPYDNFNVTIWRVVGGVRQQPPEYLSSYMTRAVSASEQFFSLSEQGTYHVKAQVHLSKKATRPAHWHTIIDGDYVIEWPGGDPIIQVTLYAQDPSLPGCQTPLCPICIAYNGG